MKKRQLLAAAIVLVLGLGALGVGVAWKLYTDYRNSITDVTFIYNSVDKATVSLYKGEKKDLVEPRTQGQAIIIENGKTYQLENWPYVVVINGTDIEETKRIVYPQQVPQTITLSVTKSSSFLNQQLESERAAIYSAIAANNQKLEALYKIEKMQLHGDGSWSTANLVYKGAEKMSRDTLHVVLHRSNDKWEIKAGPSITIHRSTSLSDAPQSVFWSVLPEPVTAS